MKTLYVISVSLIAVGVAFRVLVMMHPKFSKWHAHLAMHTQHSLMMAQEVIQDFGLWLLCAALLVNSSVLGGLLPGFFLIAMTWVLARVVTFWSNRQLMNQVLASMPWVQVTHEDLVRIAKKKESEVELVMFFGHRLELIKVDFLWDGKGTKLYQLTDQGRACARTL